MSLDGAIQSVDHGAESVFDYREADVLGEDINILMPYLTKSEIQSVKESSKVRIGRNFNFIDIYLQS